MEVFSSRTANETWLLAARALCCRGSDVDSRAGVAREILHAALVIAEPRQRWITSRVPAINPAFALAEVVWIITGRADSEFLKHWNPGLSRFVGTALQLHGAYGKRLRKTHGVDQLRAAYDALKANPTSRQVVLQIWSTMLDLPETDGQPRSDDVPCNIFSCLKVREGALHWLQVLRSNDLFLGVPHNVVQFTTLQEIMAGWLGLNVGEYAQISDSLHLYDHDRSRMTVDDTIALAPNSDRFVDDFQASMRHFGTLARLMEILIRPDSGELSSAYSEGVDLPVEYANMFVVIAADDCRRKGDKARSDALMDRCTNGAYVQLWERWRRRRESGRGSSLAAAALDS